METATANPVRLPADAQQRRVAQIVAADAQAMMQLRAVRGLGLPDWCIAGGFVRNRVWDCLTGTTSPYDYDSDVLFFDAADSGRKHEEGIEARLRALLPGVDWQVRNQARMHLHNGDRPYRDTADAMTFWLETCTAVGVRLLADDTLQVVAPLGLDDLLGLVFRPTEAGLRRRAAYRQRIATRPWKTRWPAATLIE